MKVESVLRRDQGRSTANRGFRSTDLVDAQMKFLMEQFGDNYSRTVRACIGEVYNRLTEGE